MFFCLIETEKRADNCVKRDNSCVANYKLEQRVQPESLHQSSLLFVGYPFHLLFPSRFPTNESFALELKNRLTAIPYPYHVARVHGTTPPSTYVVLQRKHVLNTLFQSPIIESLRNRINDYEELSQIRDLRSARSDAAGKFWKFHTPLAKELVRHENAIKKLIAVYDKRIVEEWIGPYPDGDVASGSRGFSRGFVEQTQI